MLRLRAYVLCSSLAAYPEKTEALDWAHYRKNISAKGFVDNFQHKYEAVKVPYPKDTSSAEIDALKKSLVSPFSPASIRCILLCVLL